MSKKKPEFKKNLSNFHIHPILIHYAIYSHQQAEENGESSPIFKVDTS